MDLQESQLEALEIWQQHPMTKWYFKQIDDYREWLKEHMASGGTIGLRDDDTQRLTAGFVGQIEAINFCTTFEKVKEGGNDGT